MSEEGAAGANLAEEARMSEEGAAGANLAEEATGTNASSSVTPVPTEVQQPSEEATVANKEALKKSLKDALTLIKTEPELQQSLSNISGKQSINQNDGQPTTETPIEDNSAKIAELKAIIADPTKSENEKADAKAELDKLEPPAAAAAGGRRRTKRKQQKKGGKSAKKGGKKHRKSSGKKSRRSSSKKSRRYGRK
jgi:hypothetical protein